MKRAREIELGQRITYEALTDATGRAGSTLARLMGPEPLERIDGRTLDALCLFFGCTVGDLLERVDGPAPKE